MNIGSAAARSGVPAKTIRYYESIGLIPPARRCENGYREYSEQDVQTLLFVQRARSLGFAVNDVRELLDLWRDGSRASSEVKRLAMHQIDEIEHKIAQLETIRQTLIDLTKQCHGDHRPDCPIIDDLAKVGSQTA